MCVLGVCWVDALESSCVSCTAASSTADADGANSSELSCNILLFKWNGRNGKLNKHIMSINPPKGSVSTYFNYNKNSVVLMAIVDAWYQFILCDFGTNERISEGGVLQNSFKSWRSNE